MDDWFDTPIEVKPQEEYVRPKTSLFDFLNDLTFNKSGLLNEDNKRDYSPYMINRFLSMDMATLLYAQEMNMRHGLDKELHYEYLLKSMRKMKRYLKYVKSTKDENVDLLSDYYQVNKTHAKQFLKLHTEEDLEQIRIRMNPGGTDGKKKARK